MVAAGGLVLSGCESDQHHSGGSYGGTYENYDRSYGHGQYQGYPDYGTYPDNGTAAISW